MLSYINFGSNWLFYFIGIGLALIVIWLVVKYIKSIDPPPHDSFYFVVTDITGKESIIHDSGIRPSKTKPGSQISLQVLKTEINNEVKRDLSKPYSIKLGIHPTNLRWKINLSDKDITEEDFYYTVTFSSPKENPYYGRNQSYPIDLREELENITPI